MKRLLPIALLLFACDTDADVGETTLRFAAWGEDFIEEGIPAETFVDGWQVEFESFSVVLSGVDADGEALPGSFEVDLAEPSGGMGHALGMLDVAAAGTPMVSWTVETLEVRGRATQGEVTKAFDWMFEPQARYVACDTGTPLSEGEVMDVILTVHADHLFYDDLDSEEPNVAFDLIAAADGDGDGTVTMDELRGQDIRSQVRYQVGGRDIEDLHAFIAAQARTVGHINGEGHCEIE